MTNTFTYVRYDEIRQAKQEKFKQLFEAIENFSNENLEDSRYKSLLKTSLEEAYMWTGKAIRDEQIKITNAPHETARG